MDFNVKKKTAGKAVFSLGRLMSCTWYVNECRIIAESYHEDHQVSSKHVHIHTLCQIQISKQQEENSASDKNDGSCHHIANKKHYSENASPKTA